MATGATGHIGLGQEAAWGVGSSPTIWLPATESLAAEFPQLRVDLPYGSRNAPRADRGRPSFSGSVSNIIAKPNLVGHLMQAALGVPTTTGAGPYVHTFEVRDIPYSEYTGLEPYSAQVTRGGKTTRWTGGQLRDFTLSAPVDNRVTFDTSWLFRGWDNSQIAATPAIETGESFNFNHAAHKRDGAPFRDIKALSIAFTNGLQKDMTQDGSDAIRATYLGTARLSVDITLIFANTGAFDDFLNETTRPYEFGWQIDASTYFKIIIPHLSIKDYQDPLASRGVLEASVQAVAEVPDGSSASAFTVEIGNTVASYVRPFSTADLFVSNETGGWWDAQDRNTLYSDSAMTTLASVGDPVAVVLDKSGNGLHLVQPTLAARPILRSDSGTYRLEFDGDDDYLYTNAGVGVTGTAAREVLIATGGTMSVKFGENPANNDPYTLADVDEANRTTIEAGEEYMSNLASGDKYIYGISADGSGGITLYRGATTEAVPTSEGLDLDTLDVAFEVGTVAAAEYRAMDFYGGLMISRKLTSTERTNAREAAAARASITL